MAAINVRGTDTETSEAPGPQSVGPRRPRGKSLPSKEHERRLAFYRAGMTDLELAEACNLTEEGARQWRRRSGLPGNGKRGRQGRSERSALQPEEMMLGRPERPKPRVETPKPGPAPGDWLSRGTSSGVKLQKTEDGPKPEPRPARIPRHRVDPTRFDPMFAVDIKTGEILVDRRPDYLRRGAAEREARRAAERAAAERVRIRTTKGREAS